MAGNEKMSAAQRRLSQRHHAPESFNLMVAGRRGVGKSTLLQTLCDSFYALQIDALSDSERVLFARDESSNSEAAEEVLDPFCVFDALSGTTQIRRCHVQIRDLERHHAVSVELIDTPGIDSLDDERASATINEISWEIERRLQAALDEELKTRRDKGALHSEHIHAVLYLVPPPVYSSAQSDAHSHRLNGAVDILSEIDLCAIRRLGQLANGIFRDRRPAAPSTPNLAPDDVHLRHRASHASASVRSLPLARDAVCIKRLHQRREVSLVRRFPWGALQLTNNSHCDFALLVDVLFHSYRRSLQCWTSEHVYEAYRMHRIAA
ncbi:hypothetical protein COEREDRAFT_76031, partial [Coemansia reversa NRRL 1564]